MGDTAGPDGFLQGEGKIGLAFVPPSRRLDACDEASNVTPEKIPQPLVAVLDGLCTACPKKAYTEKCPFPKFQGISGPSRRSLFEGMDMDQVANLFAMATDCACPKDPRGSGQVCAAG